MNAEQTGQVLEVIAAHYWQQSRKDEGEKTLQVAAWTEVFADVPREPHVNLALADWLATRKWPPQASELRALALEFGGPTPAMVAAAEFDRARTAHWTAMCALRHLGDAERRRRHAAYLEELQGRDDLMALGEELVAVDAGAQALGVGR